MLRTFHNRFCRAMCRITIARTPSATTSSPKQLYKRLGIAAVDQYYHRRLLRWAGHVSRMLMSQVQRHLLTGWVAHSLPTGSPLMTFGRTLKRCSSAASHRTSPSGARSLLTVSSGGSCVAR